MAQVFMIALPHGASASLSPVSFHYLLPFTHALFLHPDPLKPPFCSPKEATFFPAAGPLHLLFPLSRILAPSHP